MQLAIFVEPQYLPAVPIRILKSFGLFSPQIDDPKDKASTSGQPLPQQGTLFHRLKEPKLVTHVCNWLAQLHKYCTNTNGTSITLNNECQTKIGSLRTGGQALLLSIFQKPHQLINSNEKHFFLTIQLKGQHDTVVLYKLSIIPCQSQKSSKGLKRIWLRPLHH